MDVIGGQGHEGPVGPVVVVTTMPLPDDARADLSALLGPEYVVVDIKKAPTSANVVLTTVLTDRALQALRRLFPRARVLASELHDLGRGISYPGPVTRALEAGPDGYFVAHGLASLSGIVRQEARLQLAGSTTPSPLTVDGRLARVPADPAPAAPAPDEEGGQVVWLEEPGNGPAPEGHTLERRYVDDLVAALLGTSEPRKSPLWASVVAEAAAHLARERQTTVVVDVSDLPAATRAQLRVHTGSARVRQTSWPPR